MNFQSSHTEFMQNLAQFTEKYKVFVTNKNNMKSHVDIYIKIVKKHMDFFELHHLHDSLLSQSQCTLVNDIVTCIIEDICMGNLSTNFNLQYTNPNKNHFRPGRPLEYLSDKSHQWFKVRGFKVTNIAECFGVSKSCEFGCSGDGIGRICISWEDSNALNDYSGYNSFNAQKCLKISYAIASFNKLVN
jgi:hypothetical protein